MIQTFLCKRCGTEKPNNGGKSLFCSASCSNKFNAKRVSDWRSGRKFPNRSGANHHYYGKKRSEETKAKISASRKGKAAGSDSPHWKGGTTTASKLERMNFSRYVRPLVFQRDNYTCQVCQQEGGYLQADHIKSWADYPKLRLDMSNCRTLCMACHYYVTFKKKLPKGVIWGHNLSRGIGS